VSWSRRRFIQATAAGLLLPEELALPQRPRLWGGFQWGPLQARLLHRGEWVDAAGGWLTVPQWDDQELEHLTIVECGTLTADAVALWDRDTGQKTVLGFGAVQSVVDGSFTLNWPHDTTRAGLFQQADDS